jgi:hypothetical protein
VIGRAPILSISENGEILRIGSKLFIKTSNFSFTPLQVPDEFKMNHIEELGSNGKYFALTSRRDISEEDLRGSEDLEESQVGSEDTSSSRSVSDSEESSSSSSDSDSESDNESEVGTEEEQKAEARSATDEQAVEDAGTDDGSSDSLSIRSEFETNNKNSFPDDDNWSQPSEDSMSARESWSEGSTEPCSDEIDDELQWDEFASEEEEVELEGSEIYTDDESEGSIDREKIYNPEDEFEESEKASVVSGESGKVELDLSDRQSEFSAQTSDSASTESNHFTSGSSGRFSNSDDSDSQSGSGAGGMLEKLLQTETSAGSAESTCEIRIFDTGLPNKQPECVFRYLRKSNWPVFSSPPVFHPTAALAVWPVGGDEILFANFTQKTYFTRLISAGYQKCCHISIQCRFSPCGKYLHIAALDGCAPERDGDDMKLKLHISTHRLSMHKITRSPPRLIYRKSVNLDRTFSEDTKLSPSNLPYTITWTKDHIYVTESGLQLKVLKVPLYRDLGANGKGKAPMKPICKNAEDMHLPVSSLQRRVYFFPSETNQTSVPTKHKKSSKSDDKQPIAGTVILSSRQHADSNGLIRLAAAVGNGPPQGVHLTTSQFGDWEPIEVVADGIKMLKRAETWRGGQLLAKFEKFDTSEDCDIIPFMGY